MAAAVVLHAAGEIPELPRLTDQVPAFLPSRSLNATSRHWPHADDIAAMLKDLVAAAHTWRRSGFATRHSTLIGDKN